MKGRTNRTRLASLILAAVLAGGGNSCARYHSRPLDRPNVEKALTPPSDEQIEVDARSIQHPILQPLQIDLRDGLSPDEAALVAVVVNPTLQAIRDRRRIAAAQLLQAGILPNPQFSYSLDIPTGGDTAGTVNGYNNILDYAVSQLLTHRLEIQAAQASARQVDLSVAWQEWQVAESARLHVLSLIFLQRQTEAALSEEKDLQRNLDAVQKAVNLRLMTIIHLSAAKATLENVRASRLAIEQQVSQERSFWCFCSSCSCTNASASPSPSSRRHSLP